MSLILGTHPFFHIPWLMNLACLATFSHASFGTIPYPCLSLGVLAPARAILQTTQEPEPEQPHAIYMFIRVGTFNNLNFC